MANQNVPTTTVAVTTDTEVFSIDCFNAKKCWVQLDNLSPSETISGTIQLRLSPSLPWASSSFPDFAAIAPETSAVAIVDTDQLNNFRMIVTSTGAGADVDVTVKDVPRR